MHDRTLEPTTREYPVQAPKSTLAPAAFPMQRAESRAELAASSFGSAIGLGQTLVGHCDSDAVSLRAGCRLV
jgi:hypothetical protein